MGIRSIHFCLATYITLTECGVNCCRLGASRWMGSLGEKRNSGRTVKYEILSTECVSWALGPVLLWYLWMLLVLYKGNLKRKVGNCWSTGSNCVKL